MNFILKNCASALSLSFKAYKNASECCSKGQKSLRHDIILEVADDYDQVLAVDMSMVAAVTMGNIEKDMDRQGELSLMQSKAQLRSQVNANNDKGLAMLSDAAKVHKPQMPPEGVRRSIINGN